MADAALIRSDYMVRGFTCSDVAIVAADTGPGRGDVVKSGHGECPLTVALAAVEIAAQMVRGRTGRKDAIVTDHATGGRTTVYVIVVAITADRRPVRAPQWEARDIVIEPRGTK